MATEPQILSSLSPVCAYLLWSLPPGTTHLAYNRGPGIRGRNTKYDTCPDVFYRDTIQIYERLRTKL